MATRAILKTTIVFGLVSVPVRVISAFNTPKEVSLHWMHVGDGACGASVGYQKVCKGCGETLEQFQIGSGYQQGDTLIEITDAELDSLPTPSKGKIELVQFVDANEIPAPMFSTMYFLEPEPVGRMPYALLARVLSQRDVLGIGTITMRSKESLCAIRSEGDALVLETLRRPDELKPPPTLDPISEPQQEMVDMAGMLIDAQTKPFDAGFFTDHYQTALTELVAAKVAGAPAPVAIAAAKPQGTPDLMAMLKASIVASKQGDAAV
jgi:DNA end-binding protein Ku